MPHLSEGPRMRREQVPGLFLYPLQYIAQIKYPLQRVAQFQLGLPPLIPPLIGRVLQARFQGVGPWL